MNVAWWCSGTPGLVWTWRYTPFLGVWVLTGALLGGWRLAHRRAGRPIDPAAARRWTAGVLAIAVVSEWPLGALGAGYLASVAVLRWVVLTFVAAPLLLAGIPTWLLDRWLPRSSRRWAVVRAVTRWPVALLVFNAVMIGTHLPPVLEALKVTQLGSFASDLAHLGTALVWWWPAMRREPDRGALQEPARAFYLFASSVLMFVPSSFLVFSSLPLYGLFELAPPLWLGFDAQWDQQLGGILMNVVGGLALWVTIAIGFLRWAGVQERADAAARRDRLGHGAQPG